MHRPDTGMPRGFGPFPEGETRHKQWLRDLEVVARCEDAVISQGEQPECFFCAIADVQHSEHDNTLGAGSATTRKGAPL